MPTISSSLVQPLVTPSTALLTRARASPCTAACASSGRSATRLPSFCSIVMPDGRCVSSLPFGPWTITPLGIAIGFFPIRDISALGYQLSVISYPSIAVTENRRLITDNVLLPNLAQQFAAETMATRLASRHHALGRGQDIDSHAAQHPRNLGAAH